MILAVDNSKLLSSSLKGKRLALMVSSASLNSELETTSSIIKKSFDLRILLAPEHGKSGAKAAGEEFEDEIDRETGLKVISLYGKNDENVIKEKLEDIDAIVYDVQDVSMRCYTYLSSLYNLMHFASKEGKELIVLDRPNPITRSVEGFVLDEKYKSFVGIYPLALRYGMTIGETITMIKEEEKLDVSLTVIPLLNYKADLYFDEYSPNWVSPSPALSSINNVVLYTGFCLLEATNISEGRGTTNPFSFMGAPFIDEWKLARELNKLSLPGIVFAPYSFIPSFSKYSGEVCSGVEAIVTNRREFNGIRSALSFLLTVDSLYGDKLSFLPRQGGLPGAKMNTLLGIDFKSIETIREIKKNNWEMLKESEDKFAFRAKEFWRY